MFKMIAALFDVAREKCDDIHRQIRVQGSPERKGQKPHGLFVAGGDPAKLELAISTLHSWRSAGVCAQGYGKNRRYGSGHFYNVYIYSAGDVDHIARIALALGFSILGFREGTNTYWRRPNPCTIKVSAHKNGVSVDFEISTRDELNIPGMSAPAK